MPTMNPYAPPTADQTPVVFGPSESARALRRLRWLAGGVGVVALMSVVAAIAQAVVVLRIQDDIFSVDTLVSIGVTLIIAALYALTAWALWTCRPYGRALGFVSVLLSVCACPTGTLLTIWGLWVLTQPAVVMLFKARPRDGPPPEGLG